MHRRRLPDSWLSVSPPRIESDNNATTQKMLEQSQQTIMVRRDESLTPIREKILRLWDRAWAIHYKSVNATSHPQWKLSNTSARWPAFADMDSPQSSQPLFRIRGATSRGAYKNINKLREDSLPKRETARFLLRTERNERLRTNHVPQREHWFCFRRSKNAKMLQRS